MLCDEVLMFSCSLLLDALFCFSTSKFLITEYNVHVSFGQIKVVICFMVSAINTVLSFSGNLGVEFCLHGKRKKRKKGGACNKVIVGGGLEKLIFSIF